MSQENVESMRQSYEAMNLALARGEDLLPLMENIDPDIVVEMGVLEGTFRGREGLKHFLEGQVAQPGHTDPLWRGAAKGPGLFEDLRCDPEEFIDAGDHIV